MRITDIASNFQNILDDLFDDSTACLHIVQIEPPRQDSRSSVFQPDAIARLEFNKKSALIMIEFKNSGNPALIRQASQQLNNHIKATDYLPMLVAPYFGPESRQILRDNNILYIDLSGNKWIKFDSLYIDIQGKPNSFKEIRVDRYPFADKASLILRAMFLHPNKLWRIHELAKHLDITAGFTSKIATSLSRRGYISKSLDGIYLTDPKSALEDWVHSYNYKKNHQYGYYYPTHSAKHILDRIKELGSFGNLEYALTLQAGAHLSMPYAEFDTVHVYTDNSKTREQIIGLLNLQSVDKGHNIVFLDPYYRQSVFYGKKSEKGLFTVSDLQLYIDLYNYPLRGLEQAEHIYIRKLANTVGEK